MELFETHCHLNHVRFDSDRERCLSRAVGAGVRHLVLVGYDLPSSRWAVELAEAEQALMAAAGIHPHDASSWSVRTEAELRGLLLRRGIVALGEIGLDYYRDLSPRTAQVAAFRAQLDLAAELHLPIVVHTRDSIPHTLELLEPYARSGLRGVLHCWSGTPEQAAAALDMGFFLGIGGVLTYSKPGFLPEVVVAAPLDRLVLETDSPYLAPVPHRGGRNEPSYLPLVAQRVAQLRGQPAEEIATGTTAAARSLFRLVGGPARSRSVESGE